MIGQSRVFIMSMVAPLFVRAQNGGTFEADVTSYSFGFPCHMAMKASSFSPPHSLVSELHSAILKVKPYHARHICLVVMFLFKYQSRNCIIYYVIPTCNIADYSTERQPRSQTNRHRDERTDRRIDGQTYKQMDRQEN